MATIFITGSADGLGQLAAKALADLGHKVVLHARNIERSKHAIQKVPAAAKVLTGDLSDLSQVKQLANEANAFGTFDAVIHNAAMYRVPPGSNGTGLPLLFTVNTLAPYMLTCLMKKPKRLIYMSSGMHFQGDASLRNIMGEKIHVNYSDTKMHDLLLALAFARKWPDAYVNAVNPGWVPTKMGGAGAPDSLEKGYETQVWLAVSDEAAAKVSGRYFFHKKIGEHLSAVRDVALQEKFLELCEKFTGIPVPK